MQETAVQLVNLVKEFDGHRAVDGINIKIMQGEFLTLLGPSGCGKTTTLRMIAGFEQPTSGAILLEDKHVEGKQPFERDVNTVFQSYALFPHMTIYDNIAFGLTMKKIPKDKIEQKVTEALALVQLEGYGKRKPDQLSGGQRQRVAIARALVNSPKVLLLDEPMGALDLQLRKQMQIELKRLQKKLGITFIYVTHDQEEALTMSDRIAVMNQGIVEQIGEPSEIYERPQSRFVAGFIGETNLFEGTVVKMDGDQLFMDVCGTVIPVSGENLLIGDTAYIAVRPERIFFSHSDTVVPFSLACRYKEQIYIGSHVKTIFTLPTGMEVVISEPVGRCQMEFIEQGKDVFITWDPAVAIAVKDRQDPNSNVSFLEQKVG